MAWNLSNPDDSVWAVRGESLLSSLLTDGPGDIYELCSRLRWDERIFRTSLSFARHYLAPHVDVAIVCEPTGERRYAAVDTVTAATGEPSYKAWGAWIVDGIETRLETVLTAARTMVETTDARTRDGKRARAVERRLQLLLDEIELIDLDHAAA